MEKVRIETMRNKFKALGKKTQILLITSTIVVTAFLSPIFVKTVTAGEIDIFQMVSTLLGKVDNQEDKIANLEKEIDKLKEQIDQQKPDPVEEKEEPKPIRWKKLNPKSLSRKNQSRQIRNQSIQNLWNQRNRSCKYI
jgi:hypothetical protein